MCTGCEHRVVCVLQAYGALCVFTPPDTFNNLFNVCMGWDSLLCCGRIRISFKEPSCKLVQVCILLRVSSTGILKPIVIRSKKECGKRKSMIRFSSWHVQSFSHLITRNGWLQHCLSRSSSSRIFA